MSCRQHRGSGAIEGGGAVWAGAVEAGRVRGGAVEGGAEEASDAQLWTESADSAATEGEAEQPGAQQQVGHYYTFTQAFTIIVT